MAVPFGRTTRSLVADSARLALGAWTAVLVLLALWLAWFFLGSVTVVEVSRRARLEVQQSAHPVAALVTSRIAANGLVLGQSVRAGDVLVELDATAQRLRLREEEARLQAIPPRLASLRRELESMEAVRAQDQRSALAAVDAARSRSREAAAAVDFARLNERRLLEESSFGGVAQVEAMRAAAETRKQVAAGEALVAEARRLELDARTRGEERAAQLETLRRTAMALEGELRTGEASVARLQEEIDRHVVRAPVDGVVGDIAPLRAGAYVAEGQKLATVVPRGGLIMVGEFEPAAVLGRIQPGMTARLRLDGFPWAQFGTVEARVSHVASEIRDGLVRVEFTPVLAPASPIVLRHGLPGSIEVTIEQASPALLVLRAAGQLGAPVRALPEGAQAALAADPRVTP